MGIYIKEVGGKKFISTHPSMKENAPEVDNFLKELDEEKKRNPEKYARSGIICINQRNGELYWRPLIHKGKVQQAFKEQIGKVVGACVASKVKKGMSQEEIWDAVRDCSNRVKGSKLFIDEDEIKY